MDVDPALKQRINARRHAETVFELIAGEISDPLEQQVVATVLTARLAEWLPKSDKPAAPSREPLSDEASRNWETETIIPFGQHAGKLVRDVPLDYLVWLVDHKDEFVLELRRYVLSARIQLKVST